MFSLQFRNYSCKIISIIIFNLPGVLFFGCFHMSKNAGIAIKFLVFTTALSRYKSVLPDFAREISNQVYENKPQKVILSRPQKQFKTISIATSAT